MRFNRRSTITSSLRARALSKLTQFSVNGQETELSKQKEDRYKAFEAIAHSLPISYAKDKSQVYSIPLTVNEWEIFVALGRSKPTDFDQAQKLLHDVIETYFLESPRQVFSDVLMTKFKSQDLRNPHELFTFTLTSLIITLCTKFPSLAEHCNTLFDKYISLVLQLFSQDASAIFSLLGFMNSFIHNNTSIELNTHVWSQLSYIFNSTEFIEQLENVLTFSQSLTNDYIVQYYATNNELSLALFLKILGQFNLSVCTAIVSDTIANKKTSKDTRIKNKQGKFVEYLLDSIVEMYKEDQARELNAAESTQTSQQSSIADVARSKPEIFQNIIVGKRDQLIELCKFTLNMFPVVDAADVSNETKIAFLFEAKTYFLEILSVIPLIQAPGDELFAQFVEVVTDFLNKYIMVAVTPPCLVKNIVAVASLLNYFTEDVSLPLLRLFPLLVALPHISTSTVEEISQYFTKGLLPLNEDSIVNTIYSINNLLTGNSAATHLSMLKRRQLTMPTVSLRPRERTVTSDSFPETHIMNDTALPRSFSQLELQTNASGSAVVSNPRSHINSTLIFENCVTATTIIAANYNDPSITALTIAILTQKVTTISKALDKIIISALTKISRYTSPNEFTILLKFYRTVYLRYSKEGKKDLIKDITDARIKISTSLYLKKYRSKPYYMQLHDLLESIIACGEVDKLEHHRSHSEISIVAEEIGHYLAPLAALLPKPGSPRFDLSTDETTTNMFRNIWFNMAIHGFHHGSDLVKKHYSNLLTISHNTPPLASDFPANNKEMSLEMNGILRRGSSSANIKEQKQAISEFMNVKSVQPRTTSDTKVMFLAATVLLEKLRAEAGECSQVVSYFSDPSVVSSSLEKSLEHINFYVIRKYTKFVQAGTSRIYNSQSVVNQLNEMLLSLAHRDSYLQNVAFNSCDVYIRNLPSSLCHHDSLFTLLDLMTALFDSVMDCETNRFEPRYEFELKHSQKKILLPDTVSWRQGTLSRLNKAAKEWVNLVLNKSNQDIKILLQSYISNMETYDHFTSVEFGVSFAIEMAGSITSVDKELSKLNYSTSEKPNTIAEFIYQHSWRSKYLVTKAMVSSEEEMLVEINKYVDLINNLIAEGDSISNKNINEFLDLSAALVILGKNLAGSLIHNLVKLPFKIFTPEAIKTAINVWLTIIKERPDIAHILLVEVGYYWMRSIDDGLGLFSGKHNLLPEEFQMMEYKPYNKIAINRDSRIAMRSLQPHRYIIKFFISHFQGTLYQSEALLKLFTTWITQATDNLENASLHPFARLIRNELLNFAALVLAVNNREKTKYVTKLSHSITNGALSWYIQPVSWPFGSNDMKVKTDLSVASELYAALNRLSNILMHNCGSEFKLLLAFLNNDINHIKTWLNFLSEMENDNSAGFTSELVDTAFKKHPQLAANILTRSGGEKFTNDVIQKVSSKPLACIKVSDTLPLFLSGMNSTINSNDIHNILYWSPVSPLKSINLFLPKWNKNNCILQYAVLSLESHNVNVTFFYVPQIVQCLRYDATGYVEKLILDTASIDMLFSHQIIWNMLANCYKGDEALEEDEIKPTLDRVRERMVSRFSGYQKEFYEKEFGFFDEVTGISGKLKPYIKKSKAEKKIKIDEEMAKIKVEEGVYLPSNPDGVLVDIDRKSGKPLQSHAKAPFMATFKIRKEEIDSNTGEKQTVEKWQSAIFKVGDDCRQDVLALQLISMFRTIWSSIGLDVYVFPYRVTATLPGCGIIDVLPNSISRDMLGREAVNGLFEYFVTKFGNENTIEYQNARNNFVKSLAGYSVISYLLQFKDRHNGNIMYDDQGHCLHIDFGFIFDIVPGGVKFEAVPFKLTKEMVRVMGGSPTTSAYRDFEELCIKAYLAARPHMEAILECVEPMLGSGLPCFKGNKTMKNLRTRFQPQKTEHEAALYMKNLIRKSFESFFTKGYDEFQRLTNGIPY